jgi:hypothetical protein
MRRISLCRSKLPKNKAKDSKSIALPFTRLLAFTHGIPKPPRWNIRHLVFAFD